MSQGRKERTPAQLAVLAQAREKAKIVIAERAKLNALAKKAEPVSDPPELVLEDPPEPEPAPVPMSEEAPPHPTLEHVSQPENEDEEPRLPSPKYRFVHGVGYIKIK